MTEQEIRNDERARVLREIEVFLNLKYVTQTPKTKYATQKVAGMMHPTQTKLIAQARTHNFGEMTLREIGGLVGVDHPQKIDHHLKQLYKKGFLK